MICSEYVYISMAVSIWVHKFTVTYANYSRDNKVQRCIFRLESFWNFRSFSLTYHYCHNDARLAIGICLHCHSRVCGLYSTINANINQILQQSCVCCTFAFSNKTFLFFIFAVHFGVPVVVCSCVPSRHHQVQCTQALLSLWFVCTKLI